MSSEDHQEAWGQWIEATSTAIREITCLRTHSGATMISMLDRARRESEASRTRHTTMTEQAIGITFSCTLQDLTQCHHTGTLIIMAADQATVVTVQDPRDQMTERAWVCILKEDAEASHSTRTTLPEENQEVTPAISSQEEDP